ncbi:MAG: ammonia channel protein [Acidobacteria bacterium]|nr:MAG: ammonia channel protein [Acidobacteriota bacterium]
MSAADTAWMLVATALVLLMTPALGFFYGGLVRAKNALNTLMMSVCALGFVGLAWALIGYSIAFAPGNGFMGGLSRVLLRGVGLDAQGTIPHLLFMAYQATFAITIAHWVWGGGFLATMGALDFAGGTVVHVNAGVAALVAAIVLGPRKDYARQAFLPHNVAFTVLGAGLLWFGWFGFNAGSALAANGVAALAFTNTMMAPAATLVVWTLLDLWRTGRATAVGAATAIVVGLVAITPAAGFVGPKGGIILGALAALPSYFALLVRARTRLDDSLDVVAAHGLGGTVGALLTGVLAQKVWNGVADGLAFGNPRQLWIQFLAVLASIVYSAAGTFVLLKLVALVAPLRAATREEGLGLDVTQHGEEAYAAAEGAILVLPDALPMDTVGVPELEPEGGRA